MKKLKIDTVLFDIGGVIGPDYSEFLWVTERGLAMTLGIDILLAHEVVKTAGSPFYSRGANEREYWQTASAFLGCDIPQDAIELIEAFLPDYINPYAKETCARLQQQGIRIGLISDNTQFWYTRITEKAGLTAHIDPDLVFQSWQHGRRKSATPGLYDIAASTVRPETTLVIDDRPHNIDRAAARGFQVMQYMHQDTDELDVRLARGEFYETGTWTPFDFSEYNLVPALQQLGSTQPPRGPVEPGY